MFINEPTMGLIKTENLYMTSKLMAVGPVGFRKNPEKR